MGADYLAEKRLTSQLETLIISMYWYLLYPFPLMRYQSMRGFFDPRFDYFVRRKESQNCESGDCAKREKNSKVLRHQDSNSHLRKGETRHMSHKNNQCIHCSVESCQHHEQDGVCGLMDVQIAPKECCCNGKADESLCSSYKCRW